MKQTLKTPHQFTQYFIRYTLFWGLVFLLNVGPHWEKYSSPRELLETIGLITGLQFLVAYLVIGFLIPKFLNKNYKIMFVLLFLSLLFLAAEINISVRYLYLEPTYSLSYELFLKMFGHINYADRMFSLWSLKYIFFSKIPVFLYPCAILMTNEFYQKQQNLLKLNEQKSKAELNALKNQLNPHFIFNTLNNLYALALKKSDQTPVVIEKLSNILDYMLYRCDDEFVALQNEITLIENYIDLEKIRYGKRLSISFDYSIKSNIKIAPLILLSLLENACKHSTAEELNEAMVKIELKVVDNDIYFQIKNSKPAQLEHIKKKHEKIGMVNMKKQLSLLYPDSHQLCIEDDTTQYNVVLKVKSYEYV